MFIRALSVVFLENTTVELTFQDGKIIRYDMSKMFSKYPQLVALKDNRKLFENGHLDPGGYGIIWNDELDFDAMSIYESGDLIGYSQTTLNQKIGVLLTKTREEQKVTQTELSRRTNIDQSDISKIEKGLGNPTLAKLSKLFNALGKQINLTLL